MDKAVILARGLGTRMRRQEGDVELSQEQKAAADSGQKAMIRFGRPFLDYVLADLAEAGYRKVCLVIGPEHKEIRDYYGALKTSRLTIDFAIQQEPRGTADAVAAAEKFGGEDHFLAINSDNLYPHEALDGAPRTARRGLGALRAGKPAGGRKLHAGARVAVRHREDRREGIARTGHRKARRSHARRAAEARLFEHELLAVRTVDLRGLPLDQAFAARRVRSDRRRAIHHRQTRRADVRRENLRPGSRSHQPQRYRRHGRAAGGENGEFIIASRGGLSRRIVLLQIHTEAPG